MAPCSELLEHAFSPPLFCVYILPKRNLRHPQHYMPIFPNIVEEYTNSLSCAPNKVLFLFSFLNKYPQALAGCFS